MHRFFIGALVGAALPFLLGSYGLVQFQAYLASLPPETAACGNGALGPLFLIAVVTPFFGLVGGLIASARS
jgi:hypothetical protein